MVARFGTQYTCVDKGAVHLVETEEKHETKINKFNFGHVEFKMPADDGQITGI